MKNLILGFALLAVGSYEPLMAGQAKDDCSFIRDEISQVSPSGGEVVIPEGTYTCLSPVVLDRSHITLRGQGQVTLRLGEHVNSPVLILGDIETPPRPIQNVQVSNLNIDGNRWYQELECWGGPCDSGAHAFIRNNGITVRAVTKARIQDVNITGARSGGIVTEKGCYDLVVDNLSSVDNEFDGFAGYETTGAQLTRMHLARNRAAGISLDIRFRGNFFQDIKIEDNGDVGIFIRDSSFNIFESVSIVNSGNHGVFLAQDDRPATCALNNEFHNLTVTHSRGTGIRLNDICGGNTLTGTALFQNNRNGCIGETKGAHLNVNGQVVCQD